MAIISKKNMATRVAAAAEATPGIEDRLQHARDIAHLHPIDEPVSARKPDLRSGGGTLFITAPIDLIDPNPYNARKIYRPERIQELAASIGAHGQDVPGIATQRNERYVLAAGHYRLRALKFLGLKTMDLMVHEDLSDKDLFEYSYRENAEREGQTALDNALCWRELLDLKLFASETELAEATRMSLPNINKTLRILKLSPPVLDIVKEDPAVFALSTLYELALFESVSNSNDACDLAKLIKTGDAGRNEVNKARKKIEEPNQRKEKEMSTAYKIKRDSAFIGSLKAWDSGRITLDVMLSDGNEREMILNDLKKRFDIST